jgi:hypothetical protein
MAHDHATENRALLASVAASLLMFGSGCGTRSTSPAAPPDPSRVTFFCSFASAFRLRIR